MLFAFESKRRHLAGEPPLRVFSGPEVEYKLKTHRLDEMLSMYKPVSIFALNGKSCNQRVYEGQEIRVPPIGASFI